jgi:hypothetical protein
VKGEIDWHTAIIEDFNTTLSTWADNPDIKLV